MCLCLYIRSKLIYFVCILLHMMFKIIYVLWIWYYIMFYILLLRYEQSLNYDNGRLPFVPIASYILFLGDFIISLLETRQDVSPLSSQQQDILIEICWFWIFIFVYAEAAIAKAYYLYNRLRKYAFYQVLVCHTLLSHTCAFLSKYPRANYFRYKMINPLIVRWNENIMRSRVDKNNYSRMYVQYTAESKIV